MNTQQKAEYLLNKFYIPLLNENIRLALIFCDEMLIEWNNEGGRLGKIKYWEEVKSIIKSKEWQSK